MRDIRDHGAIGDGCTPATAAIQEAIDSAHRAGGGVVNCPPGEFLIGSIELKSNVALRLEAGSRLLASTDQADYDASWKLPVKQVSHPHYCSTHLIWARDAENVAITGRGVIDGQAGGFHGEFDEANGYYRIDGWRPLRLIAFIRCADVLLEGITIRNAPGWTVWPLGCERVRITGIKIRNNHRTPNSDGLDPDCCRDVVISDCALDCGDDCIALKSSASFLGEPKACENVVVTNCVMRSTTCGVRVGYEGDGPIRNCTFSNLVVSESRTGINMLVPRHEEIGILHGPTIENLTFSNITMDTQLAFQLWIGHDAAPPGAIRNVTFADIAATTARGCYFGGSRAVPLEAITLDNVRLAVRGEMDDRFVAEVPDPYRVWEYFNICGGIPHALYFRDARDIRLRNCRVRWADARGAWQSALAAERVEGLDVADSRLPDPPPA